MGWLDRGNTSKALSLFRRGYANAQKPFQVWTEGADGTGCVCCLCADCVSTPMAVLPTVC